MGYLLLSPSPSLALRYPSSSSSAGCRHRARRGAAIVASSASTDGGLSPSQAAAYVLVRRAVLLGVSALPLLRLRDTAAVKAAPSSRDIVTVYCMSLPQGFIRRKGIDAPRIDHQALNCYKTFKIGRKTVICRPNEATFDGQNSPLI